MARLSLIPALLAVCAVNVRVAAQTLLADLDYGSFQGIYNEKYNISLWEKIPFAAPPVGQNRFRAPQPPSPISGVYDSNQTYTWCPEDGATGSEDCLYLGVSSRPWTKGEPLRPVLVNFYGGAFIRGGGSAGAPGSVYPTLNVSNLNSFVIVYPNYRTNIFGFLPGREIFEDPGSDLNPGLLDQHAALTWAHKYISAFGGDPANVTIWGQSAGAGSVVAQVIAQGGKTNPPLFQKALASSPFWPKTYQYDAPEAQWLYDQSAAMANCSGPGSLKCLKATNMTVLRSIAYTLAYTHTYNTSSYTWAPVIGGSFLTQSLTDATAKGETNGEIMWGMYNTYEGENFIPPGFQNDTSTGSPPYNSSEASFDQWLAGFLPKFSPQELGWVKQLYPAVGSTETIESYNTTYVRASLIFRDLILACPGYWAARAAKLRSYIGEYSISPAKHASDTEWWNSINAIQQSDPFIYDGYAGAFASFIQTGDPNAHKLSNASEAGVPENKRTGEEWVVTIDQFETVKLNQLNERCAFWRELGPQVPV